MITEAHSQVKKAIEGNKSAFWSAAGKTFNDFNRNTGLFQTRKK
jgi:hypothetical protein